MDQDRVKNQHHKHGFTCLAVKISSELLKTVRKRKANGVQGGNVSNINKTTAYLTTVIITPSHLHPDLVVRVPLVSHPVRDRVDHVDLEEVRGGGVRVVQGLLLGRQTLRGVVGGAGGHDELSND